MNIGVTKVKYHVFKSLAFGAVFIKEKLAPNRVELVNILQKVQVFELLL